MSETTARDTIELTEGYRCPECSDVFGSEHAVADHHGAKHGGEPAAVEPVVREIDAERTFEALYNLNKHARKYADLADENYRKRKKATAHANSIKKQALYDLKAAVLETLAEHGIHDRAERHAIDGRPFYCLYFGDWSYHTPVDEWRGPELPTGGTKDLDEFDKQADKERSDMSLKDALLHVQEIFGESANDYLEEKRVAYGSKRYFVGWDYLD